MNSDLLRREIESILRGYYRKGLVPSVARDPVLGAFGAARIKTSSESGEPLPPDEDAPYSLYHGWLTWYPPDYPGGPPPARVYTDTGLSGYLTGLGTVIPGSSPERTEHLIGLATKHATDTCTEGVYSPTWADPVPELDAEESYLWPKTEPSGASPGCLWTGEAIAMDAALRGAGRTWADVLPSTWTLSTTGIGVYWLNGGLWVAWVGSAGMVTARISVPVDLACVLAWEVSEAATDFTHDLYRSWIYAHGKVLKNETVYGLLDGDDMALAYAGGASSLHPQFGWHWLYQNEIDDPVGCVQVLTTTIDSHYVSRTAEIEITWDSENSKPVASLSVGPDHNWGGPTYRVRVPTGNGLETTMISGGSYSQLSDSVIYGWTTIDGPCWLTKKAVSSGRTINYGDAVWPVFCGSGGGSSIGGSAASVGSGGFAISGARSADCEIEVLSSFSTEKRSISVSVSATENKSFSYNPSDSFRHYVYVDVAAVNSCTGGATQTYAFYNNDMHYSGYWYNASSGIPTVSRELNSGSGGDGGAVAVLLPMNPGVIVITKQTYSGGRRGSSSVTKTHKILIKVETASGINVEPKHGETIYYNIGWSGESIPYSARGYGPTDAPATVAFTPADEINAALVTGRGTIITGSADYWHALLSTGPEDVSAPWVLSGPRSEFYQDLHGETQIPAGISEDIVLVPRLAPVGIG